MSLKQSIEADMKKAMLAKDKDRLRALRGIKSAILLAETEKGNEELNEEKETAILMKAAKQRRDSAEIYVQQNRQDLADVELKEVAVIEEYLPAQLSDEEIEAKLKEVITQTGASGPSDMGKVMGVAMKELSGQADGKKISTILKGLLAG